MKKRLIQSTIKNKESFMKDILSFDEIFDQKKAQEEEEIVQEGQIPAESVEEANEVEYKLLVNGKTFIVGFSPTVYRKWMVKDDKGKVMEEGIGYVNLQEPSETFEFIGTAGVSEALRNLFEGKRSLASKKKDNTLKKAEDIYSPDLKELTSLMFQRDPDIQKRRFLVELEEGLFNDLAKSTEEEGVSRNLLINLLIEYFLKNKGEMISKLKSLVA
jgi:hypothetical protein